MPDCNLLQQAPTRLSSGIASDFKIECDALTLKDWSCAAALAVRVLGRGFRTVEGVPHGGLCFASLIVAAQRDLAIPVTHDLLIVDDVLTSGASMERHRDKRYAQGVVLFARGRCPSWIQAVFQMPPRLWETT